MRNLLHAAARQDEEHFGGLREDVLKRGRLPLPLLRRFWPAQALDPGSSSRPGVSLLHLMISLCRKCHAKVERTKLVISEMPALLLILWREKHPDSQEQLFLDFRVRAPPAVPVPLFARQSNVRKDGGGRANPEPKQDRVHVEIWDRLGLQHQRWSVP